MADPDVIRGVERVTGEHCDPATGRWEDPVSDIDRQREREANDNAPLLELAGEVPGELKAKLAAIHDGLYCAAHNEGLNCCLDFLLGTWGPPSG
jgi:hypothetical protein